MCISAHLQAAARLMARVSPIVTRNCTRFRAVLARLCHLGCEMVLYCCVRDSAVAARGRGAPHGGGTQQARRVVIEARHAVACRAVYLGLLSWGRGDRAHGAVSCVLLWCRMHVW